MPTLIRDETEISNVCVKKKFKYICEKNNLWFISCKHNKHNEGAGFNLVLHAQAPPRGLSSLNNNAVPVMAILHVTHEISLHTVQALFGCIEGFWSAWTPIFSGPSILYTALEDLATKHFLNQVPLYRLILLHIVELMPHPKLSSKHWMETLVFDPCLGLTRRTIQTSQRPYKLLLIFWYIPLRLVFFVSYNFGCSVHKKHVWSIMRHLGL